MNGNPTFNLRDFIFAILTNGKLLVSILLSLLPIGIPSLLTLYVFVIACILMLKPNFLSINKAALNWRTFLIVAFFASLLPSIFVNNLNYTLASDKLILIIYNLIVPVFLIFIFSLYKGDTPGLLRSVLFVSRLTILSCVVGFLFGSASYSDDGTRLIVGGVENPIWLSRYLSFAFFSIIYIKGSKLHFVDLFLLLIAVYFMFQSGSRGPFVALGIAFMIWYWIRNKKFKVILLGLGVLLVFIILSLFSDSRVLNLNFATDFSALHRIDLFVKLFASDPDIIFGFGLGNFGPVIMGIDERVYPHNIFLELFFETGVLSLTLFAIICYKTFSSKYKGLIFHLFTISFINSNFSGDLAGNADLFVYSFVILAYTFHEKNTIFKLSGTNSR